MEKKIPKIRLSCLDHFTTGKCKSIFGLLKAYQFKTLFLIVSILLSSYSNAQSKCEYLFTNGITHVLDTANKNTKEKLKVVSKKKGPAASESGWIVWLNDGSKGFFKPINVAMEKARYKDTYQSPYNEAAAFIISQIFNFNVVPKTIITNLNVRGKNETGSLQIYVEGKTAQQLGTETQAYIPESDLIWLFDKIISNSDRSTGNYIITEDGRQHAIDNGRSFFLGNAIEYNMASEHWPAIKEKLIATLRSHPEVLKKIKSVPNKYLREALADTLYLSEIKAVLSRIQTLRSLAHQEGL